MAAVAVVCGATIAVAVAPGQTTELPDPQPIAVRATDSVGDNAVRVTVPEIDYHPSTAVGATNGGRLLNGVLLPPRGEDFLTWDPILLQRPNREWRRWGTDTLIRQVLRIAAAYRDANPTAPPLLIGDISRPHGGDFGKRFGGIGHASHQNGLDIDIYYPRKDGAPRAPLRPAQVDTRLAQDLLDRFLTLRPEYIFVGPSLPFTGPRKVVVPLVNHDNHLHLRIRNPLPQGGAQAGQGD